MFHHFAKKFKINDKFSVHRKMNQSEDVLPENSTSITTNPYTFPLGIDEYDCFFDFCKINIDHYSVKASCIIFKCKDAFSISIIFTHL